MLSPEPQICSFSVHMNNASYDESVHLGAPGLGLSSGLLAVGAGAEERIRDSQLLFQDGMELELWGVGGGEWRPSPCPPHPPTPGKVFCPSVAFLFLQKLSLAVPALSSSGWDRLTQVTRKSGRTPRKPAASSSAPGVALLWPQDSAQSPGAGRLL